MRWSRIGLLAALLWHGTASAQDTLASCAGLDARALLDATLDVSARVRPPTQLVGRIDRSAQDGAATGFGVLLVVQAPTGMSPREWSEVRFIAAARSQERLIRRTGREDDYARAAVLAELVRRDDTTALLRVFTPERTRRSVFFSEGWQLVVLACRPDFQPVGFAAVPVRLNDWGFAVASTVAFAVAGWLFLAFWAWRRNAKRMQDAWRRAHPGIASPDAPTPLREALRTPLHRGRVLWKLFRAADPVFISQDGLGNGSLGRLQLLLFSTVVASLLLYVYMRTGILVGFSTDLLTLLGITGASTALARLASAKRAVSYETEAVLLRLGVVDVNDNMPNWGDVIASDGEIDVTRIQALLFSVVVLFALVLTGSADLAGFTLPREVNWLLGISQGVYVAGKLVPSEACGQLDTGVRELIKAAVEKQHGVDGADVRFTAAKEAVKRTLREVYGSRARLNVITNAKASQIASAEA
ncbi:hypothetical protein [Falsiroseomonas sp. HW251]|uniref:hypothetical protein n=1 Tax=Falsiroseomonas sp. HW251 TaxID=3390998 RepID=UPI003D312562